MKRVIASLSIAFDYFNEDLANRFVAYCKKSRCPRADIMYMYFEGGTVAQIQGVPVNRLEKLVANFVNAVKKDGENIIFKLCEGDDSIHYIKTLCYDTSSKVEEDNDN